MKKITVLSLFAASLTFAGVININQASSTSSENLSQIKKISFTGAENEKSMSFSGTTTLKDMKVSDIESMKFDLLKKSSETMSVKIDSGIYQGVMNFNLKDVASIVFEEEDNETDSDGDGLTDLRETYFYGTNPRAADTDGDGWSDRDEIVEKYSANNPTVFNARIADVPALEIVATRTPVITLNITTEENTTESKTVSEGKDVSLENSVSYESSRSSDLMHAWEFSTTHGWELGTQENKYVANFTLGYNGSYTTSNGVTWGSSEQTSVTTSYESSIAKEKSEGKSVSGATLCMQVSLKNTGSIAYTIEALKLNASVYDVVAAGNSSSAEALTIIADLDREGGFSDITLPAGQSVSANFCNENVALEKVEKLIHSTGVILLGSASQKITISAGDEFTGGEDFTSGYTNVAAKTADITIDYGPGATNKEIEHFRVATRFKYNQEHTSADDMYEPVSLAELLEISKVSFVQDSVKSPNGKKVYGLVSVGGFKFSLADSAWWFVSVQKAADIGKGKNEVTLYALPIGNFDLNNIYIDAGDAVQIFYSIDADHDGLPARTERLVGSNDLMKDTDSDGLTDYEEVTGWSRYDADSNLVAGPFYTSPTLADTDGDGVKDFDDDNPNARTLFEDAEIDSIMVRGFNDEDTTVVSIYSTGYFELMKNSGFDMSLLSLRNSYKPYTHIAFKLKTPVSSVKVSHKSGTSVKESRFIQPGEDGVSYEYATSYTHSVANVDTISIEIVSENDANKNIYKLAISAPLEPPSELFLGRDDARTSIIGEYALPKDKRVQGYVVVRGVGSLTKNYSKESALEAGSFKHNSEVAYLGITSQNALPTVGSVIGSAATTVAVLDADKNQFTDKVGGGSDYLTYRVYSYVKENGKYYFSSGSNVKTRSVGRVLLQFKLDSLWSSAVNCYLSYSCDVRWKTRLMDAQTGNTLHTFKDFYRPGSKLYSNTSYAYNTANNLEEGNNKISDDVYFYYNVGNKGFDLWLQVTADKYKNNHQETKNYHVDYSAFTKACSGNSQTECLPNNGDIKTIRLELQDDGKNYPQAYKFRTWYYKNGSVNYIDDDAKY